MRKIVFTVLIVVVSAVVGFFCWQELQTPDINYVADFPTYADYQAKIQRLYAADVDVDAYNAALEEIMKFTEYTEEEMYDAAIASGEPAFFPSFNISVYPTEGGVRLIGAIDSELAVGQKEERFKLDQVGLEAQIASGALEFDRIETVNPAESGSVSVTKINNAEQMLVDISGHRTFELFINGENDGTVILQFVYSIQSDTIMPKTVLEDQLLQLNVVISKRESGILNVEFIPEPYSSLEDLEPSE